MNILVLLIDVIILSRQPNNIFAWLLSAGLSSSVKSSIIVALFCGRLTPHLKWCVYALNELMDVYPSMNRMFRKAVHGRAYQNGVHIYILIGKNCTIYDLNNNYITYILIRTDIDENNYCLYRSYYYNINAYYYFCYRHCIFDLLYYYCANIKYIELRAENIKLIIKEKFLSSKIVL